MSHTRSVCGVGGAVFCSVLAIILTLGSATLRVAAAPASDPQAAAVLQQFLDHSGAAQQYSAARRLEATGSGQRGWLEVQTVFAAASGFSYQITSQGGSRIIRSRFLKQLLDEEQKLIERKATASVAISPLNYTLTPEGANDEGLIVVRMEPLRKDRSLIAGQMFLTPDGDLVRVEGKLAKNPSFWVSRVSLVRSYRRINGIVMPVSLDTTARVRLFGSSSLRMTYDYSQVDDRLVAQP